MAGEKRIYCEGQVKHLFELEGRYNYLKEQFRNISNTDFSEYSKIASEFFSLVPKLRLYPEFFGEFFDADNLKEYLDAFLNPDSPGYYDRVELARKKDLERALSTPVLEEKSKQDDLPF